jgi:hypothetical protein
MMRNSVVLGLFAVALAPVVLAQDPGRQVEEGVVLVPAPLPAGTSCPLVITGVLGSGSNDWPSVSGNQNARLNRNGVASTCVAPKICDQFATGTFPFDAYSIPSPNPGNSCVTATLTTLDATGCNLQINGYLGSFDPGNICTNYLADAGLSSGIPPNPTSWSAVVPAGQTLTLVVHNTTTGVGAGCNYRIDMSGDCVPVELQSFDID